VNKVSGHYLSCIVDACVSLGLSKKAISTVIDTKSIRFEDPLQRFDGSYLIKLYEVASIELNEPNIGLKAGAGFNVSWLNETGKLLPLCETLGEAGLMLGRYHRLTQSFGASQVRITGSNAILEWQSNHDDFERYKHAVEAIFTGIMIATKWLLWNEGSAINYIQFRHAVHGNYKAYEDILGCPVYFSCDVDAIGLNGTCLSSPLVTHNPSMKVEMCRKLDRFMLRLSDQTALIPRVEASIREQLHEGAPSFSMSAKHLDINPRSLRSQLQQQSTSFRVIVETVRREICEIEMRKNTQISFIAQKLGFYDQSAFNHSFHKWYGMSPREYQASHFAALGAK